MANDIKFTDNSVQVKAALGKAVLQFLEESANELVSRIIRNIDREDAVDTGQLKGSFRYQIDEQTFTAYIGSELENAIWTEYGTGEHAAKGNGRKGIWAVPAESVTGRKKPTVSGSVQTVYGKDGKVFYLTDGKPGIAMMGTAYKDLKQKIIDRGKQIFGAAFGE